mmetsp:Transcript_20011/g.31784  ORF Transcript_20011/g.31784 Transcript_20011/m.31784 type:complete len:217 (-) Transcript_20011:141-791(-)
MIPSNATCKPESAIDMECESPLMKNPKRLQTSASKNLSPDLSNVKEIKVSFQKREFGRNVEYATSGSTFHIMLPSSMSDLKISILRKKQRNSKTAPNAPKTTKNFSDASAPVEVKNTQRNRYDCQKCEKSFKTKYRLRRHNLTHNGIRPFSCELCSASFRQKPHLKGHLKAVHFKHCSSLVTTAPPISDRNIFEPLKNETDNDLWSWMECIKDDDC